MALYTKNIPAIVVSFIALLAVIGGAIVFRLVQPPSGVEPAPVADVQPQAGPAKPVRMEVFRSPLAGTWYSAEPNALRAEIAGYFEKARRQVARTHVQTRRRHRSHASPVDGRGA